MAVYFKFSSWSKENYDTVVLDTTSPFISVGELKQAIIKKKKIDKSNQLVLTNAQTNEEYNEDSQLIQKNTSVLVRLIPIINQLPQQPTTSATASKNPRDPYKRGGTADDDFGTAFWEESNPELAQEQAIQQLPAGTEEDKILAIINQAGDIPMASLKGQPLKQLPKKIPPVGYVCFRCNQPGHFIYDCPTNGDPNYNFQRKPVTMYGVPKSFLVQNTEGKAFEFKPNEGDFSKLVGGWNKNEAQNIPKELTCPICKKLLNNAVMIPCCNETSCDDCIRSQLMEKTNFHCPLCNSNLVPDQLLPNKAVRRSVESYKIGKPIDSTSSSTLASSDTRQSNVSPRSPISSDISRSPTSILTESNIIDATAKNVSEPLPINSVQVDAKSSHIVSSDDRNSRKRRSPSPSYPSSSSSSLSSSYDRHPPKEDYNDDYYNRRYGRPPSDYRDRDYDYRDRDRFYRDRSPPRYRRSRSRSPKRRLRSRTPPYYRRSRSRSPRSRYARRDRSRSRSRDRDRTDVKKRSTDHKEDKPSTTTTTSSSESIPAQKSQDPKPKDSGTSNSTNKEEKKVSSATSTSISSNVKKDNSSSRRSRSRSRSPRSRDIRRDRSRSRDRDRTYRRRYSRSRSRERDVKKRNTDIKEDKSTSSSSSDKKSESTHSSSSKTTTASSNTSNTTQTEVKKNS